MAVFPGPVQLGKTTLVMREVAALANTKSIIFPTDADTVQISLWVDALVGGVLTVTVKTLNDPDGLTEGKTTILFPTISSPTSDLLIRKAAETMGNVMVTATWTGTASFRIRAKGISLGESSTKILGSSAAVTRQATVSTVPSLLIPSSITDRSGLVLKNHSGPGILWLGFDAFSATDAAGGYPIEVKESMAMDLAAGVDVYASASTGTIDVRIIEAGD